MSLANSAVSGIADAWDTKQRAREKDLEEWAQDNPQWWVIGLATLGSTGMTVAGGFVDVLRIGEGAAEGGVMGIRSCGPAYDVYQRRRNGQPSRKPPRNVRRPHRRPA
ncbi:MAG: hypothetical protein ACXW61_11210, partial [Gemmatirosa sp.]